jgi:hypothetical protein
VKRVIGEKGEKLRGPIVSDLLPGIKRIEVKKNFRVAGSTERPVSGAAITGPADVQGDVLGVWMDDRGVDGQITIYRKAGRTFMRNLYSDGSVLTTELLEKTRGQRRVFVYKVDPGHGEYFLVAGDGALEEWDPDGLVFRARRTR